jgi:hypothetical protein
MRQDATYLLLCVGIVRMKKSSSVDDNLVNHHLSSVCSDSEDRDVRPSWR